jgi:ATP-dependent Lhr-like helicase
VLRGRFSPGATEEQWCERHLLARIHRYTVKRLRREIEPVALQDFMRFLFDWQHLSPHPRPGQRSVAEIVGQFEGYPRPLRPGTVTCSARLKDYSPSWLDDLCRSGKLVWTRLSNKPSATALRSTPMVLLPRSRSAVERLTEQTTARTVAQDAKGPPPAQHGALFFDELIHEAHLLRSELETPAGTGRRRPGERRQLRRPARADHPEQTPARSSRRGRGAFVGGMDDAGRWALLRRGRTPPARIGRDPGTCRHDLLRRYGVVFWRLLEREADWLPSWRELLRTFHRLEARARFAAGALSVAWRGAVCLARGDSAAARSRRRPHDGSLIAVCGSIR